MNWWQRLKKNPLARFGAILLLIFYISVFAADFVAPYDPYDAQANGSLLPPTTVYWNDEAGFGPHVYPTTQGKTDLDSGDRLLLSIPTTNKKIALPPKEVRFYLIVQTLTIFSKSDRTNAT